MMSKWYQDVFGFKKNGRNLIGKGTAFIWHFGFLLSSVDALVEWQSLLRGKGLAVTDMEGDERYRAIRLQDPEGNDLELFWEPSALKEGT